MGCNCGKRTRPTGYGYGSVGSDAPADPNATDSTATQAGENTTGQTQSFTLSSGGRTQTYGSRLERDAAAVRAGQR